MGIGVGIIVLILVLGGVGVFLGKDPHTPQTIEAHYHQKAFKEFKGKPDAPYEQVYEFVALARRILKKNPNLSWNELEVEIESKIADPELADKVLTTVSVLKVHYLRAARQAGKKDDMNYRNEFILAALNGFLEGTMEAEEYSGPPTPGMERAR